MHIGSREQRKIDALVTSDDQFIDPYIHQSVVRSIGKQVNSCKVEILFASIIRLTETRDCEALLHSTLILRM